MSDVRYHVPSERPRLTPCQYRVLVFIEKSIETEGFPPTLREICDHLGVNSTNGMNDHLRALEKKGAISRAKLKSRGIRILVPSADCVLLFPRETFD